MEREMLFTDVVCLAAFIEKLNNKGTEYKFKFTRGINGEIVVKVIY